LLKGLDQSAFSESLKKIPEMNKTLIDFFTKQIDRFTASTEETKQTKETKETNEKISDDSKEN